MWQIDRPGQALRTCPGLAAQGLVYRRRLIISSSLFRSSLRIFSSGGVTGSGLTFADVCVALDALGDSPSPRRTNPAMSYQKNHSKNAKNQTARGTPVKIRRLRSHPLFFFLFLATAMHFRRFSQLSSWVCVRNSALHGSAESFDSSSA